MADQKKHAGDRRYLIGFSVVGSILTILFFAFINYTTSPRFPWFIFPSFAVLWWPILTIFIGRRSMRILSLIGSLVTIAFLFGLNYITSWGYPWFLYPSFAVLWWPLALFFGARNRKLFSVVGFIVLTVFFMVTNLVTSPNVIWFYYPVFGALWWPLSMLLAGPKTNKIYSVAGAVLLLAFLSIC